MDLFSNQAEKSNDDYLHSQLIKLGDMMGDGLHHEPDGKWIEREYKKVAQAIFPDTYRDIAKAKAKARNEQMVALLKDNKCQCGGILKQSRSGSKVCNCMICGTRYRAGKKK